MPTYLSEYVRAFRILHTRRTPSPFGGINPVSLVDLKAYLDVFGYEYLDIEEFFDVMILADSVVMKHEADKAKAAEEDKKRGRTGKDSKG